VLELRLQHRLRVAVAFMHRRERRFEALLS
jgi:hypothetical protein